MAQLKKIRNLLLATTLLFLLPTCALSDPCGNRIIQHVMAPKDPWEVVVFERDCGATTGFSTHISIIQLGTRLPNDGGNVFIADAGKSLSELKIGVRWVSNREIEVTYPRKARVFKLETKMRHVNVTYHPY